MVTTSASIIHTFETKILEGACPLTFAAHGVTNALPLQPLHILISNFSVEALVQQAHMVVAFATEPPTFVIIASFFFRYQLLIETHESLDLFAVSDKHSSNCDAEHNSALYKVLHANHSNVHNFGEAVHSKPRKDWESKIDEHIDRK